ncbi:hypothetical protein HY612_02685, partial [Candidatus Roizmanbacteria bacterium]|nr:hypothetical protein [Candidatus Roizmanbacteria bacterium]
RFRIRCGMTISIFFVIYALFLNTIYAFDKNQANNKYGIHLAQPHLEDLQKSKELVNSNGGDWGYVILVLQENDRDKNKWQEIFDKVREFHLIPIIRLATVPQADKWRRPNKEDAESWVNFLDSLHWVVKDRYVILFNEPNHGAEWGGEVDANNYAEVAITFAKKLREKSQDFFVMLAGFDASAPNSLPYYQDEAAFVDQFFSNIAIEQFNNLFSGLASHSYPNPGFSGSPHDIGRGSIRTYDWELSLLKQLGAKDLPVFITETGWKRGNEQTISEYFKLAFTKVWLPDEKVVAVTPFVLDYQGAPFLNFSWKKYQNNEFYPQFYTVQSLSKIKGDPIQLEKGEINFDPPKELVAHSSFHFTVKLKNLGQGVWDKEYGYQLSVVSPELEQARLRVNDQDKSFEYFFSDLKGVKPFGETEVDFYLKTNGILGKRKVQIVLEKNGQPILDNIVWQYETVPLPSLNFRVNLLPKLRSNGDNFEIQIFNENEEIVFKKKGLIVKGGQGKVDEVKNLVLGRKYRIVVLKQYYLPRQGFITFNKGVNKLKFERMLPFDFNPDGKLDLEDIWTLLKEPKSFILLFP